MNLTLMTPCRSGLFVLMVLWLAVVAAPNGHAFGQAERNLVCGHSALEQNSNLRSVRLDELRDVADRILNSGVDQITLCMIHVTDEGSVVSRRVIVEAVLIPTQSAGDKLSDLAAVVHVFEEVNPLLGSWRVSDEFPVTVIGVPESVRTLSDIVGYISGGVLRTRPVSVHYRVGP